MYHALYWKKILEFIAVWQTLTLDVRSWKEGDKNVLLIFTVKSPCRLTVVFQLEYTGANSQLGNFYFNFHLSNFVLKISTLRVKWIPRKSAYHRGNSYASFNLFILSFLFFFFRSSYRYYYFLWWVGPAGMSDVLIFNEKYTLKIHKLICDLSICELLLPGFIGIHI